MSIRLYVGNLPKEVEREELQAFFGDANDGLSVKLVTDRKTGKCRGFAFVTVETDEAADQLIAEFDGKDFKESSLKVEKAQPRKKKEDEPAPKSASRRSKGGNGGGNNRTVTSSSSPAAASQPDPRWADELAKLKQMLEAQTTNS